MRTLGTGNVRGPPGYVAGTPPPLVPRPHLRFEIGLVLVILIWGVNFAVIKVPLEVAPPFVVNLFRFVVSLAVLGGLHLVQSRQRGVSPLATLQVGGGQVLGLGLLGIAVYQVGFIVGVDLVTAGMAALLIASSPLWTAVAGHVLGTERLTAAKWTGIGVSLSGVALVVWGAPERSLGGDVRGVALMLGASVAWGLYTALSRPLLQRGASPVGLTFWGIVVSFPLLFAMAAPQLGGLAWDEFGLGFWAAIVFSGGLSTGLAYGIWNAAVHQFGPSPTAIAANAVPVVGVLAGVVFLDEPVLLLQLAGGALVIAGVVLVRRAR